MDLNSFGANDWLLFSMILLFYIVPRVAYRDCDLHLRGSGLAGGVRAHHRQDDGRRHGAVINVVVHGERDDAAVGVNGKSKIYKNDIDARGN